MMKKLIPLMLLLIICSAGYAQDNIKVELMFSGDSPVLPDQLRTKQFLYRDFEASGLNFTAGLLAEFPVSSRFSIRTGASFSKKDYNAEAIYSCMACSFLNTRFLDDDFNVVPITATFTQEYVEVPVALRFYIIKSKFSFFADAGVTGSFLSENTSSHPAMNDLEKMPAREFTLSGQVGAGAAYSINSILEVSLSATYRNAFADYAPDNDYRLKSEGLIAGIAWKIR